MRPTLFFRLKVNLIIAFIRVRLQYIQLDFHHQKTEENEPQGQQLMHQCATQQPLQRNKIYSLESSVHDQTSLRSEPVLG